VVEQGEELDFASSSPDHTKDKGGRRNGGRKHVGRCGRTVAASLYEYGRQKMVAVLRSRCWARSLGAVVRIVRLTGGPHVV
jgi:hypothetical protein